MPKGPVCPKVRAKVQDPKPAPDTDWAKVEAGGIREGTVSSYRPKDPAAATLLCAWLPLRVGLRRRLALPQRSARSASITFPGLEDWGEPPYTQRFTVNQKKNQRLQTLSFPLSHSKTLFPCTPGRKRLPAYTAPRLSGLQCFLGVVVFFCILGSGC